MATSPYTRLKDLPHHGNRLLGGAYNGLGGECGHGTKKQRKALLKAWQTARASGKWGCSEQRHPQSNPAILDTALGSLSMGSETQQIGGIDRRCNADSSSEGAGDCCQENRSGEGGGERSQERAAGTRDRKREKGTGEARGGARSVKGNTFKG